MYDRRLIKGLKKGDKESYREFIDSSYSLYFSFAYALVKDRDAAKDILQNVFLKLFLHRNLIDEDKNLHAFVLQSVRFEVCNYLRLGYNARRETSMPDEIEGQSPDPEMYYDDVFGAVKEALRTMPPKRREAFVLGRIQGKGHQEVARRMGISVRTVEKHIELASKDIKKALESLES